ncbi:MAG: tRNA (guanosine(37)-N1)-methyltransferase TrmD [Bacilli bacterium]|nr:tRNA (guanosine(37)-N1)-methyltransferase TrmD [Bacilli bacterium]
MRIDILTLFPSMFEGVFQESIIKRAIQEKKVEINIINFREYSTLNNHQVDDTPYGGGAGMVLRCEPLVSAIESVKKENTKVYLMTPQGVPFKQELANSLAKESHIVLVCGHYEGFDERIKNFCDGEISIGDYVLTGGEIPAMAITDSIVRLLPGVIKQESYESDSFQGDLLDYPTYTKPYEFRGYKVPEVLVSGNHQKIREWREQARIENTKEKRRDLLDFKEVE